ncbi:MFS transporter [Kibdelosporangium aridum]|uniref:Predicted arabinose efflux permease, MFS family n=2 Tax=Kibdelosporangium aridum TaxID=2030 RepID=A0A1Y5XZ15_KIBAR|nr:MFS transporter [Kibdelosporangium aridum]SMD20155.1 Predicted arabinose efflux permease, MFS family [Kibdelosporangium aridum]
MVSLGKSDGYRGVVTTPGWLSWAVATFGARLPVAMAPLALVLVGHAATGGYVFGGLLVAAHTLGEALAAPITGALVDRWSPRRTIAPCLAIEAALFGTLALLVIADGADVLLLAVAALAGAIPAGAPGGLRSTLTHVVGAAALPRALSLDTVINQTCWALAPIIVSVCAGLASPTAAIALVGVFPAIGMVAALYLPRTPGHATRETRTGLWALTLVLHRTLLLTAVLRLMLGAMTVAAPPLFDAASAPALAGFALGAYAVGTAVGGLLYGMRRTWPGTHEQQADVCLLLLGIVIMSAFFVHHSVLFVLLYGVAGLLEGPVVLARSLHLEDILPGDRRAMGFSLQYAAIGWGFAAGGFVLAQIIGKATPQTALTVIGGLVAAASLLALLLPSRRRRA